MKRYILIFIVIFSIKLVSVIWLKTYIITQHPERNISTLAIRAGDTYAYLEPFKNLKDNNEYYSLTDNKKNYAGRMPFYGSIYYLLYKNIDVEYIFNFYIILQLLLETLAIILIAILIKERFWKSQLAFWLSLIFMTISLYTTTISMYILPESFGISLLSVIIFLYSKYKITKNIHVLLLISFMLTILVGLKPYFGVLFIFFGTEIIICYLKKDISFKLLGTSLVYLSVFFILFVLPWSIRNYKKTDRFIPLTDLYAGIFMPHSVIELRNFIADFGESSEYWDKKAMGSYFYSYPNSTYNIGDIPKSNYYTNDSIVELKEYFTTLKYETFSEIRDAEIVNKLKRYQNNYTSENLFEVYFVSPLKLIKNFTIHSGSYYLPYSMAETNLFEKLFKSLQSVLYYLFLILGFIGLVLKKDWFLLFIPVFLIILFVFVLQAVELRFFTYSYPSLVIGMFYYIGLVNKRFKIINNQI